RCAVVPRSKRANKWPARLGIPGRANGQSEQEGCCQPKRSASGCHGLLSLPLLTQEKCQSHTASTQHPGSRFRIGADRKDHAIEARHWLSLIQGGVQSAAQSLRIEANRGGGPKVVE